MRRIQGWTLVLLLVLAFLFVYYYNRQDIQWESDLSTVGDTNRTTGSHLYDTNREQNTTGPLWLGSLSSQEVDVPTYQELLSEYPHCFSFLQKDKVVNNRSAGGNWSLLDAWLSSVDLFYIPTDNPPRYNHMNCFVMKARYNCAYPPSTRTENSTEDDTDDEDDESSMEAASSYKLVWRAKYSAKNKKGTRKICDLRAFVEYAGGPIGVARLLQRIDSSGEQGTTENAAPMVLQVLMQGNSYLRQVWEALVCGFRHQITDWRLLMNGPPVSKSYIESRMGKLLVPREMGQLVNANEMESILEKQAHENENGQFMNLKSVGCHAPAKYETMETYFRSNVSIPSTIPGCSDDIAMVEFGSSIRFHFLFHPWRFNDESLAEVYRSLELPLDGEVHSMFWEGGESMVRRLTPQRGIPFDSLLPALTAAQNHSLGYVFGADNPWIKNPPDDHPCMPGIPDDEVNILLFLLVADAILKGNKTDF